MSRFKTGDFKMAMFIAPRLAIMNHLKPMEMQFFVTNDVEMDSGSEPLLMQKRIRGRKAPVLLAISGARKTQRVRIAWAFRRRPFPKVNCRS